MRPPTRPRPLAERPSRTGLALAVTLIGSTATAPGADACRDLGPDATAQVSLALTSDADPIIGIAVFETRDEEGNITNRECHANVRIPIDAFPSVSNRIDTNAIARAIQESAAAFEAESCGVTIAYDDPEDDLSLAEECVTARFGFSSSDYWTQESESSCWSDETLLRFEEAERSRQIREARDATEADAFAAAEDGLEEWGESLDAEAAFAASEEVLVTTAGVDTSILGDRSFED